MGQRRSPGTPSVSEEPRMCPRDLLGMGVSESSLRRGKTPPAGPWGPASLLLSPGEGERVTSNRLTSSMSPRSSVTPAPLGSHGCPPLYLQPHQASLGLVLKSRGLGGGGLLITGQNNTLWAGPCLCPRHHQWLPSSTQAVSTSLSVLQSSGERHWDLPAWSLSATGLVTPIVL